MAASSSSSPSGPQWKYDVFINFRGEDTRKGFVSHLYRALRQKPINTFIDAQELRKGDRLSELLTAVRESRLSIVVFSQNYASSTWCLKELMEILKCKATMNQIVLPIFYEVDPSDVRKLKRRFAEAFAQHDHDSNAEMEEVQSWRSALTTATSLSGWDSRNYEEDAKLIEDIVEDVFKKLIHISSTPREDNGLVEMDSHMHEMHLRLHPNPPGVELDDVRVVGIWGMGGLGKTTIARAVYEEIACRFEARCFLENVKEGFMKHGELHMRTQLLCSISDNKVGRSDILKNGFQVMLKSLGQRKVLVVVDDVDKLAQIEALLGKEHSFGGGSRIIITTRDVRLLSRADAIYSPKILCGAGALELFKRYAFRTSQPTRDYDDLSRRVVQYAQGLPLALKVLGAFLDNKTVREWEDVVEKIRKIPQREIHDVLKTSFDGLDDAERDIFLDIACFFTGMQKDYAIEIMDGCGFYPHTGIRVLIDRALITVSWRGELEMHDSLQEMGREIVRQKSVKEPGRRSRLWSYEDVRHVLTQNTGTEAVESIILELSKSDEVCLNAEAFDSMTQLRLLRISHSYGKQHLIGHLKFLSHELRCLSWPGSPLRSLPSNFQFKNLVDLDMQYSCIEQLWEGTQTLGKLKFINLRYCKYLKETPDFTKVPNLERLICASCISLVEVHPSILTLTNLVLLDLSGCNKLTILASNIRMQSLETLDLSRCSSLEMFPEILEVMEELQELNLSQSKIKELPSSINNLTGLRYLKLKDCKELKSLPSIRMKSLKTLDLSGCSSLEMFPEILEVMEELPELDLSGSKIKELPLSINNLTGLRYLNLKYCMELKSLPSLIHMRSLKNLYLYGCSSLEMFPEILEVMEELAELNLSRSKIKELPSSINNLTGLRYLKLKDCKELKSLPSIRMKSLKTLDLSGCSSLEMFPEILEVMEELPELDLSGSKIKELPSSINNLTGLRYLNLKDCKELKSLPSIIHMRSLIAFDLSGCSSLEMFPEILEVTEELLKLDISGSKIKELPSSINNLTGLRYLNLKDCKELKSLPSVNHMRSLVNLGLSGCSSLEMFPEILEVTEELLELNISRSKIKELPSSINNLTGLRYLNLKDCKELKSLPSVIHMRSLKNLYLSGCSSLEMFPEILEVTEELEEVNLSGSKIKELPSSINNLMELRYLNLKDCKELKSLPSVIHMRSLIALDLSGCSSLDMFPEILEVMEELIRLDLSGSKIKKLPSSINNLIRLEILILKDCKELRSLPRSICHLESLYYLSLSGCTNFEVFPNIEENMEGLRELHLDGTSIKELPPSIEHLQWLELLNLENCESLVHLPDTLCHLARLAAVNLSGCTNLSQFPVNYEDLARL
ncbi:disease resistance protein RPV1 isoform X4 [Pyrus x bretschneideri]|uniref:disease resistance protein RPV1 isoform X4 n=1 Tax=Pyrus x bretschneideri TaxID=225117 RepID=UPI00202EAF75|nr:disease resistance protein RPV1 isoform X4 [Pyrus x bretschneideri]